MDLVGATATPWRVASLATLGLATPPEKAGALRLSTLSSEPLEGTLSDL